MTAIKMNQVCLDDWITVTREEVPQFLRTCPYFLSLGNHDPLIKVPRKCYRSNLSVHSESDAKHLLFTMQFWGVKYLPQELVMFFLTNPDIDLDKTFADFTDAFDFTVFLKALCSSLAEVSYFGRYYNSPRCPQTLDRQGDLLPNMLSLLKLQYQHQEGVVWNAKTCMLAAQMGWLDCLQFLRELGCPWDARTCAAAAGYNRLDCLQYAHTQGCPWTKATVDDALRHSHMECYHYARNEGCPVGKSTSAAAAGTGVLAILQDLHEAGCPWDASTCASAARANSLACLAYAREHGCRWNEQTCADAAGSGSWECLKYARERRCPWDTDTCAGAAGAGRLDILTYAHKNGCPLNDEVCESAARGHLDCLKYAREHGCPWGYFTLNGAAGAGSLECIKYAKENGCPWNSEILHQFVKGEHLDCIQYVLEAKFPKHSSLIDYAGKSMAVMKFLHEECHQPLSAATARNAARHSLECLQYCIDRGCPVDTGTMTAAVHHLDRVQLLRAHGCPWDKHTLRSAVPDLACMRYLLENGCPGVEELGIYVVKHLRLLRLAHSFGCTLFPELYMEMPPMECVQFLCEQGVPWPPTMCRVYAYYRDIECLRYALEHGAPCDASACAAAVSIPFSRFYGVKLLGSWHLGEREYYDQHQRETLECLKCLHEHGCPWDARTCNRAARHANTLCLEYALAQGCPRSWARKKVLGFMSWITGQPSTVAVLDAAAENMTVARSKCE